LATVLPAKNGNSVVVMPFHIVLASVAVADFPAAVAWYARALGRPSDSAPMAGLAEWHLTESGWLQVVDVAVFHDVLGIDGTRRAGASSVAFVVTNLAERIALLRAADITIGPEKGAPGSLRTATLTDPEGNLVTFVENPIGGAQPKTVLRSVPDRLREMPT
jgi:catechol 2,3-dioxygenase-like lactoylglutathione lyase family enzyme